MKKTTLAILVVGLVGCDQPPPAGEVPVGDTGPTVTMVQLSKGADGTVKTVEQRVPLAQVRAMHARREAHMRGVEQKAAALTYVGYGGPGCAGSGCENPNVICDNDDYTWVYNRATGWGLNETDAQELVIGCFGGTGSADLMTTYFTILNNGRTVAAPWCFNLRSLWSGNHSGYLGGNGTGASFSAWQQVSSVPFSTYTFTHY